MLLIRFLRVNLYMNQYAFPVHPQLPSNIAINDPLHNWLCSKVKKKKYDICQLHNCLNPGIWRFHYQMLTQVAYSCGDFVSLFVFLGCIRSIWKFLGQGSNLSCSHWPIPQQCQIRALSATYVAVQGNAGSLTHWVRLRMGPVSSGMLGRFLSTEPQWEFRGNC